MFVTVVTAVDGSENFRFYDDKEAANLVWSRLVELAVEASEDKGVVIGARMFEFDGTDQAAARKAITSGSLKHLKSVTVRPPRNLMFKVKTDGKFVVNEAVLNKAQAIIDKAADEQYPEWARKDLHEIQQAVQALRIKNGEDERVLRRIFKLSYRIEGRGGSFGYDLMTAIGHHLCEMVDGKERMDSAGIDAIQVHIDAMKLVIAQKLKGDGGAAGVQVMAGLKEVFARFGGGGDG